MAGWFSQLPKPQRIEWTRTVYLCSTGLLTCYSNTPMGDVLKVITPSVETRRD
jgi:hypothetical protein